MSHTHIAKPPNRVAVHFHRALDIRLGAIDLGVGRSIEYPVRPHACDHSLDRPGVGDVELRPAESLDMNTCGCGRGEIGREHPARAQDHDASHAFAR
jgi:hypothetical protein